MDASLLALLDSLTSSLQNSVNVLPNSSDILPLDDGISLIDVKNDCLLSYLQNLSYLILLKLRGLRTKVTEEDAGRNIQEADKLEEDTVKKLVELRHYVEKGVWPLESKLKYQVEKVVRAASDVNMKKTKDTKRKSKNSRENEDSDSEAERSSNSSGSASRRSSSPEIDELSYRPNPSALLQQNRSAAAPILNGRASKSSSDVYRPPRITPTAYPSTTSSNREKRAKKPLRSSIVDEFITNELSAAPAAQPSVGSAIDGRGRRTKSNAERAAEAERAAYEEENFIRLPQETKKERAKLAKGRPRENGYGGEEWRLLSNDADRIQKVTRAREGRDILEKSRKRPRISTGDLGGKIGDEFAKRKRSVNRSLKKQKRR